jgi:hypothetical protein
MDCGMWWRKSRQAGSSVRLSAVVAIAPHLCISSVTEPCRFSLPGCMASRRRQWVAVWVLKDAKGGMG